MKAYVSYTSGDLELRPLPTANLGGELPQVREPLNADPQQVPECHNQHINYRNAVWEFKLQYGPESRVLGCNCTEKL
jgi:hypothetical protein